MYDKRKENQGIEVIYKIKANHHSDYKQELKT